MRAWVALVAVLLIAGPAWAQGVSPCVPSTATHQRWTMKTRAAPAGGLEDAQAVTIRQMVRWAVPRGKNLIDEPIVERERTVVTVRGFVRLAKLSPDDCDIHIQLGAEATRHHPQIIAEIPPDAMALRLRFAVLLGVRVTKAAKYFDGAAAVPMILTGYAFLDSSHWSSRDSRAGYGHGRGVATLWEIHPVLDVR